MKRFFFSIIVLIATSFFAKSEIITQTIRGTVIDKQTRTTLPGANVILTSANPIVGKVTDENGYFRLENIEIGRVSLKVSFVGYHEVALNNLNLQSGKELVLNIELEEMVHQVEAVVVTAKIDKTQSMNRLATVSARSFSVEETERYAGSRNDVARMAANYAGVLGVDDSRNDIIIRGNSPMGLLWRLDGVDIPNPNHWGMTGTTGGPVSMLNNTLLTNSDFMTGAFPAEYGNALSGVFDLRMRNGNNEKFEFLGQMGFNGVEFGAEGPINREKGSSFLLNYRYSTMGVFSALGMDFGTVGVPYYQDLSFKLNFPNTKLGSISVFGLGGISDIKIWDSTKDTTDQQLDFYGGEGYDLTNGTDMGIIGLNQQYQINSTTYLKVTLAGMAHRMETVIDSLVPVTLNKVPWYRNDIVEKKLFTSATINKRFTAQHTLRGGIIAKLIDGNMVDSVFLTELNGFKKQIDYNGSSWLVSPFVQWQYRATDQLTFNTGLHYMYFMLNNTNSLEPRLGMRWQLEKNHALSLGYGLHSQTANVLTYFLQERQPDGTYTRPNIDLALTKSHHLVLGYDLRLNAYTRVKAEAYYQYIFHAGTDATESNSYSMLNQGASFYFAVPSKLGANGKGKNYGVELTVEHFLNKGFYFLTTASLYDSKYTGSDDVEYNSAFNSNYVFNGLIGKEFVFGKSKKSKKSLSIDLKTVYAGGKRSTPWTATYNSLTDEYSREWDETKAFSLRLKDYTKTDLKIFFRLQTRRATQEFGIEITNLFNNQNIYGDSFNKRTGTAEYTYQVGMMAIPQFRIIF